MPSPVRHPYVGLRDTIAIKMMALFGPNRDATPNEIQCAREIVDDLAEYIRTEL